jgi:hypothetical protein
MNSMKFQLLRYVTMNKTMFDRGQASEQIVYSVFGVKGFLVFFVADISN